jgi:DNA-binding NarL/FixJ family response regulator
MAIATLPEFRHQGETESLLLAARATTALAELAAIARAGGDNIAAAAHATEAARYAQIAEDHAATRAGRPPAIALWAMWAAADADRAADRDTPEQWAAVVAIALESGRIEDVAGASLQQARSALDAGRRDPATIEALRHALSIAESLQAKPLRERAVDLARRARLETEVGLEPVSGGATTSSPARGTAALTSREIEVLALLADGLTNRRIGRELFISEKTASVHVSNIIGKLGAGSRTEAVAVARRRGLLGA